MVFHISKPGDAAGFVIFAGILVYLEIIFTDANCKKDIEGYWLDFAAGPYSRRVDRLGCIPRR